MNKQESRLIKSVLATLIAGIALIYTFIRYSDILFAVIGISILFLITAYFLMQNLIAFSLMRSKSLNVHLKEYIDDISTQIENLNAIQAQIGKANYLYTKQTAQTLDSLEHNYAENQAALAKNFASLSSLQNKATKINIKYDQDNTTKVIAAVKEMRNQLNETMVTGFDQAQPNNADIIAILTEIVNYLKTQTSGMNQGMEVQLNNVANQLQNISTSIQHVQVSSQSAMQPAAYAMPANPNPFAADTIPVPEAATTVDTATQITEENTTAHTADVFEVPDKTVSDTVQAFADSNTDNSNLTNSDMADMIEPVLSPTNSNDLTTGTDAASDNHEDSFVPTFTVVDNSETIPEPVSEEPAPQPASNAPEPIAADPADANKMLSPDEIAALFASMG